MLKPHKTQEKIILPIHFFIICHKVVSLSEKLVLLFIQFKLKHPKWQILRRCFDAVDFTVMILPQKSVLSSTLAQWLTHIWATVKFCSGDFLSILPVLSLSPKFCSFISVMCHLMSLLGIFSFFHRHIKACSIVLYYSLYRKWIFNCWSKKISIFYQKKNLEAYIETK